MTTLTSPIPSAIDAIAAEIVATRRMLHRIPELGFREFKTSAKVAEILATCDLDDVQTGVCGTGIVAILKGAHPGPCVLVRADMDALPIGERNTHGFVSEHAGAMHACGHDTHMAMALAVARVLPRFRDQLHGTVKFVFQPAEEGPGGAKPMIEAGVLENPRVDVALGLHIWSGMPTGTVAVADGPCMANADFFDLTIIGKGGHGAMPHLSVDALVTATQVITLFQTIVSRNVSPMEGAVITVGKMVSGDNHNIIAHDALLSGTVRSFKQDVADLLPMRMEAVIKGVCEAAGATYEFDYRRLYPATVNDPRMAAHVRASAAKVVDPATIILPEPIMGGEDMAFFLQAVPGCFFFIGSGNPALGTDYPHHHPHFDVDEDALAIGAKVMAQAVMDYLAPDR